MPLIPVDRLHALSREMLGRAGTPQDIAQCVARALVTSNVKGVDSHGVIRVPQYLDLVRKGEIAPATRPATVQESECTAVVDGQRAFGQLTARYAMDIAIEKARQHGVAAVTLRNSRHIGRVGEYVEMAIEVGFLGLAWCSAGPIVAPYGGKGRILGTNPVAIGIPTAGEYPFVLDFATSVVSEGKLRVAKHKGLTLPPGTILDPEGRPSVCVDDFYRGGALLPLGAYKGYGLSLAVQIIGTLLAGSGMVAGERPAHDNGALFVVLDPGRFCDPARFREEAAALCRAVKRVPLQDGFGEILIPGEPEYLAERERWENGIPLAEDTWRLLAEAALALGLSPDAFQEPAR